MSSSNFISGINVASLCVVSTGANKGKQKWFIAQRVVGPSKQLKQITQIFEHKFVKNTNKQDDLRS